MKKLFLLMLLICGVNLAQAERFIFTVGGDESSYNQVKIINETTQKDFRVRVVFINDENDKTKDEVLGIYNLKEPGDSDFCNKKVKREQKLGIDMPKDFKAEVSFSVEYKDYPLFDAIVIHITETSEF